MSAGKRINFRAEARRGWSREFKVIALLIVMGGEALNFYADYGMSDPASAVPAPGAVAVITPASVQAPLVRTPAAGSPGESPLDRAEKFLNEKLFDLPGVGAIERSPEGLSVILESDRFFAVGTAEVNGSSLEGLKSLAGILNGALDLASLEIEGHTDDSPVQKQKRRFRSNWELSAARASALLHVFEDSGIPKSGLKIAAFGDSRPLVPNRNERGEGIPEHLSKNRRMVLRLTLNGLKGGGRD